MTPTATAAPTRVAPRVTVKAKPSRDRRPPYRFALSGRLVLPAGLTADPQVCSGKVSLRIKAGRKSVAKRRVALKPTCRYATKVKFAKRPRAPRGHLKVAVRFGGNARLLPASARALTVRVG